MSSGRQRILDQVARGLRGLGQGRDPAISREYGREGGLDQTAVLDLFRKRVEDYNASVLRCPPADLAATVAQTLQARGLGRLAVPATLPGGWLARIPEGSLEVLRDGDPHLLSKGRLASVQGTLTGCALAVAETGTLILDGGEAQGRRALTLLPDYHLCVVFAGQVVERVPEAVDRLSAVVRKTGAPLTFVSGPSATSDIELKRVEGVHGPRTLHLVLVEES